MRQVWLPSLVGVLLFAVAPAPAQSQGLTISRLFPQPGQTVTFESGYPCGGDWLLNGTGAFAGYFTQAGPTLVVSIPNGAVEAGAYQMTLDPGLTPNCNYATVNFAIVQPGLSLPTGLSGLYSFLCRGHDSAAEGGGFAAAAGYVSADGAGKFSSGLFDFNSVRTTLSGQALTGTYTVDSAGTGKVVLATPLGTTQYDAVLNPSEIAGGGAASVATLVEHDSRGSTNSCTLSRVGPAGGSAPAYPLPSGAQLLQLEGEARCTAACSSHGAIAGGALITLNHDMSVNAVASFSGAIGSLAAVTLTGNYSENSANIRTTLKLSAEGESLTQPVNFVIYPADQNGSSVYLLSIDPHARYDMLAGTPSHSGLGLYPQEVVSARPSLDAQPAAPGRPASR